MRFCPCSFFLLVAVSWSLLAIDAGSAHAQTSSLRCKGELIARGNVAARVRSLCGDPITVYRFAEWRESAQRVRNTDGVFVALGQTVSVEQWTLAPQPGRFVTTLRFENGQLASVYHGERLPEAGTDRHGARCRQQMFRRRTPAPEVMLVCGEPDDRSQWVESRTVGTPDQTVSVQVTRERWTYSYGRERFLRFYLFENGRLVEQRTGPRGF